MMFAFTHTHTHTCSYKGLTNLKRQQNKEKKKLDECQPNQNKYTAKLKQLQIAHYSQQNIGHNYFPVRVSYKLLNKYRLTAQCAES